MKRKVGRPKKFKDKALLHVWVEREVVEKVDRLKDVWSRVYEGEQRRYSRGDVISALVLEDRTSD